MAILHVKTPNGTTKTVDLETMNITSSLQQNGWCKLPNGLIIQWARLDINERTFFSYTYPISFTALPTVSAAGAGNGTGTGAIVTLNSYFANYTTKLDVSTYVIAATSVYYNVDIRCRMIAIGY